MTDTTNTPLLPAYPFQKTLRFCPHTLFKKHSAFFEKSFRLCTRLRRTRGGSKYTEADVSAFFPVKKSFSLPPGSHIFSQSVRFDDGREEETAGDELAVGIFVDFELIGAGSFGPFFVEIEWTEGVTAVTVDGDSEAV